MAETTHSSVLLVDNGKDNVDHQLFPSEEAFIHLREQMDLVKKGIKTEGLDTAISMLQDISKQAENEELQLVARYYSIMAVLTKFGIYGWAEDLDKGRQLMHGGEGMVRPPNQDDVRTYAELQVPTQLVEEWRNSLNAQLLETIILDAEESVFSHTQAHPDRFPSHKVDLLIMLGNAFLIKYLYDNELSHLHQATNRLQEAELICIDDVPRACLCLSLQACVETLRLMAGEDPERCVSDSLKKVEGIDAEGMDLYRRGEEMERVAVDDGQLQEVITLFAHTLRYRMEPHPQRFKTLNKLRCAHVNRWQKMKTIPDLDEAIKLLREELNLRPKPSSPHTYSLEHLANCLSTRFSSTGKFQDLDEAISLHREGLDLQPAPHPRYFIFLERLAIDLRTRCEHKRTVGDLEESILLCRILLDRRPLPNPEKFSALGHLGLVLSHRYLLKGGLQDLEESITLFRDALSLPISILPQRSLFQNMLSMLLLAHFGRSGNNQNIDESIALHRTSLDLLPKSDPSYFIHLKNLAATLLYRFQDSGTFEDLDESILLSRSALNVLHKGHPDRYNLLDNLGNALDIRFGQNGVLEDINESIALREEALDLVPLPDNNRAFALSHLAMSLSAKFNWKKSLQDLDRAIVLSRDALAILPADDPDRYICLESLAASLLGRFGKMGKIEDINECILIRRQVLDLMPAPHALHFSSITNLAGALGRRYEKTKTSKDFDECTALLEHALDLRPPPHPARYLPLKLLAQTFSYRLEISTDSAYSVDNLSNNSQTQTISTGNVDDIDRALLCCEEASCYEPGPLIDRFLSSTMGWVKCAEKHRPVVTLKAYRLAIELLPRVASLGLTLRQRQTVLNLSRELVGKAAHCAIHMNECNEAVMFLTTGRSVFWSQTLLLRTPVDDLASTHPIMAQKLKSVSRQLERGSYSKHDTLPTSESADLGGHTSLHALAKQRNEIIKEIRNIPGYEKFMHPPSFSSVQDAAINGPIIFLNAARAGCDALLMRHKCPLIHVPLTNMRFEEFNELKTLMHTLSEAGAGGVKISQNQADALKTSVGRDMFHANANLSNEDAFRSVLECLWIKVVFPVLKALDLKQSDSPQRIWWCPTGPFTFLPIHAAGIYSEKNEPIDCLFQYAVSSYCISPQDLLHPEPQITQDFKMTAVIEPQAPGVAILPATLDELKRIERYAPDTNNLITHVGSNVDDLISDIQRSSFVHFGCHGMQNLTDPLESHLLLSEGKLTMSKIIKECQVPKGALAYLSACETAKGDDSGRPDESLNLVATMMFAGFRGVVGTMWSIFDADAPLVADVFYRHLFRRGKMAAPPDVRDASYGLHLATKELRERGKSFYSWVPYVYYGI